MITPDPQSGLSTDARLLLAAVRLPYDAEAPEAASEWSRQADWPSLLELARRHGVLPLCFHNLRQAGLVEHLPEDARAALRDAYDASLARTTSISARLGTLLAAAEEAGIQVLCLKGPLLADLYYPHPAARPLTDVDLLIRQDDLGAAEGLLSAAGYRLLPGAANPVYVLGTPAGDGMWDLQVELHTELLTGAVGNRKVARLATDHVWQRAEPASLSGQHCLSLSPHDNLIFLGAHMTVHHGRMRLLWLADLTHLVRAEQDRIRWDDLVQASRRYGVRPAVGWPLRLARELLAAEVPEEVLGDLGVAGPPGRLARFVSPQAVFAPGAEATGDAAVLARSLFLEHWRDRLFYFAEMARAVGPAAWPSLAWRFLRAASKMVL